MRSLASPLLFVALMLTAAAPQPGAAQQFALHPGDVVQVKFWREPKLSGEYTVDEQGQVMLPILGSLQVADRPWHELRDSLFALYHAELSPGSVSITPLRRLFLLGSVKNPGVYLADPAISLAGTVALAGGATPDGDLRRVRVVRNGVTVAERVAADGGGVAPELRSGDQIYVDRRSWMDRNSAVTVSSLFGLAGVLLTVILLR